MRRHFKYQNNSKDYLQTLKEEELIKIKKLKEFSENIIKDENINNIDNKSTSIDNIVNTILENQKFKLEKYYNVLNKFINEKCEYDYQRMTNINELQTAFNSFLLSNEDVLRYNISFKINLNDIPKIDSRFIKKKLIICIHCKKRQFVNCCDKYVNKPIHTLSHILNLRIKDS